MEVGIQLLLQFSHTKMFVGTTSGISATYESRPSANDYRNDSFTDSCSTSSVSSNASEL
jgi:hypothetical protein